MQLVRRHGEEVAHPAVGVYAQHLQVHAAVGLAGPTRNAPPAVEAPLDGAAIANLHGCHAVADGDPFDAQLVAEDARVGEIGHLAVEGVDVGAANADAVNAHHGLSGRWVAGWIGPTQCEPTGALS